MTAGADYNKLEAKQAKRDGAVVVANSGRGMRKGDARTDDFLIDYKFTEKASYSLGVKDYQKFKIQSYSDGDRQPVVVVIFDQFKEEVAMVDWQYLKDLVGENTEMKFRLEGLEK